MTVVGHIIIRMIKRYIIICEHVINFCFKKSVLKMTTCNIIFCQYDCRFVDIILKFKILITGIYRILNIERTLNYREREKLKKKITVCHDLDTGN